MGPCVQYTLSAEGGPEGEVVGEEWIFAEEGAARILHAYHALTLPIKACAKKYRVEGWGPK